MSMIDLSVKAVMLSPDKVPVVAPTTMLKEALEAMTRFRLGIACVVDDKGQLQGVFTDGDVRRILLREQKPFAALFAEDVIKFANRKPTSVSPETSLPKAVELMEEKEIWDLPVRSGDGSFVGLLHLHPAIKRLLGL